MATFSLANFIGYLFAKDDNWKETDKQLNYVVGKDGYYEYRKGPLGTSIAKVDDIPNLKEVQEGIYLDIPKIPFGILNYMTAWHRAIYTMDKTESTIMMFYNEDDGYKLFVPLQENSGANSKYKRDDDPEYRELCETNKLVMVAHSHPWKGSTPPGPSGTDNNDEKEGILYMIMNNVEGVPNVYVSTCPGAKRVKLKFFDIFENPMLAEEMNEELRLLVNKYVPEKEIFELYSKPEECKLPKEWLAKHSKEKFNFTRSDTSKYLSANNKPSFNSNFNAKWGYSRYDEKDKDDDEDEKEYQYSLTDYAIPEEEEDYNTSYYNALIKGEKTLEEEEEEEDPDDYEGEYLDIYDMADQLMDIDDESLASLIATLVKEGKGSIIKHAMSEDIYKPALY